MATGEEFAIALLALASGCAASTELAPQRAFTAIAPDFSQSKRTLEKWEEIERDTSEMDTRRLHVRLGVSLGSCRREHVDVYTVNACGDLSVAGDLRIDSRFHLELELAGGVIPRGASGDAVRGVARDTGGPLYFGARPALGFDVSPLFFLRLGPQLRLARAFNRNVSALHGAIELGSRVGRVFELALRLGFGADQVIATDWSESWAFSFGAQFVGRWTVVTLW